MQYNLFDWQSLQPYVGPGAMFFQFCDALEVKDGVSAGPDGWGLDNAIMAWGNFWNTTYYTFCECRVLRRSLFGTKIGKQIVCGDTNAV